MGVRINLLSYLFSIRHRVLAFGAGRSSAASGSNSSQRRPRASCSSSPSSAMHAKELAEREVAPPTTTPAAEAESMQLVAANGELAEDV
jgi:predicted short-subunit dehydrogenase-like oxidoreductase (DUF2520 family)